MPLSERIVVDPKILAGKPVIRGTRLAVEFILELLAAGQSESDILTNYPGLTREDVLACLSYASYLAHEYKAFPMPG
ncbi:MAG: antitoxin [Terriglobia bacterium]|nr:MAG: antitoxin [Terriglobia bacterium]